MDPVLELQGAIIQRLRSFPALVSLIGQRSYDNPPTNDQGQVSPSIFPYVSIGASSAQQANADCIFADDIIFQLDVWSIEPAKSRCATSQTQCVSQREGGSLLWHLMPS